MSPRRTKQLVAVCKATGLSADDVAARWAHGESYCRRHGWHRGSGHTCRPCQRDRLRGLHNKGLCIGCKAASATWLCKVCRERKGMKKTSRPRQCRICGTAGHNRRTCPRLAEDPFPAYCRVTTSLDGTQAQLVALGERDLAAQVADLRGRVAQAYWKRDAHQRGGQRS